MTSIHRAGEGGGGGESDARGRLHDFAEQTKEGAERVAQRAREEVEDTAEQRKGEAAGRLEGIAGAVHTSADELRSSGEDWLAGSVDAAARHLDGIARSLRDKPAIEFLNDVQAFGREHPATFFGAAVALGFGAARVAQSSQKSRRHEDSAPQQTAGTGSGATETAAGAGSAGESGYARNDT